MATEKNNKESVKWPKKLSKLGEYLKSGQESMFPGIKCDMRLVLK
jgi:hypothetical protein